MKKSIILPLIIAILLNLMSISAQCGEQDGGIIYGPDHSYILKAPDGWVLDNEAGVKQGIQAVFYPVGSSWAESKAVMYTRVQDRDNRSLDKVIEQDLAHSSGDSPTFKATKEPPIISKLKQEATVRYLSGDKHKSYEAVAYFEEPKLVILIILSSRNKEDFDKSLNAFESLVKSYQFFNSTTQNEPAQEALKKIKPSKP
jgi:hypothetical protein